MRGFSSLRKSYCFSNLFLLKSFFILAISFIGGKANTQCDAPTGLGVSSFRSSGSNVNINWNAVPTATQYEYAITNSSTPPVSGTSTINTNASEVFVETDNYIHVRAICPGGTSAWSTSCFAIPAYLSGAGIYCDGSTASIGIANTIGGQQYYWYLDGAGFVHTKPPPSGDGGSQSYNLSVSAAAAGTYYINVFKPGCLDTYFGNAEVKYSYAQNLATTNITLNSVAFSWNNSVSNVNHQYAVTTDINPPFTPTGSTFANDATVTGLSPNTTYYIHVQGDCDNNSSSYNDWNTITFNTLGVLPIKMDFFKGRKSSTGNQLQWKSICSGAPSSVVNFDIERSNDGRNFVTIHSFEATYERCLQPFDFTDQQTISANNYYRVKITEQSGKVIYSSIIKLTANPVTPSVTIFPNPVQDNSILQFELEKEALIEVAIMDINGKLLFNTISGTKFSNGVHQVNLNTASLKTGVYLCKVSINASIQVIKLIKP